MKTLFINPANTVDQFKRLYDVDISEEFVQCANAQLSPLFNRETGLKFSNQLCIAWAGKDEFFYERGPVSRLLFNLYVNHNWNPLTITWTSKSGKVYGIDETDIDCGDIVFSFEQLDPLLYRKQLYPGDQLPFKLKGLTYELVVTRLNREATIEMQLKDGKLPEANQIISQVYDFVNGYNDKAMRNAKGYDGVVHNIAGNSGGDTITFEVDMGTAGPHFYEKLLPFVSDFNALTKLEIL
jgi:hypothetical protein